MNVLAPASFPGAGLVLGDKIRRDLNGTGNKQETVSFESISPYPMWEYPSLHTPNSLAIDTEFLSL